MSGCLSGSTGSEPDDLIKTEELKQAQALAAMEEIAHEKPANPEDLSGRYPGRYWHEVDNGARIYCDLCPRACVLKDGDRGFCFVRQNQSGQMILTTYGYSTGFCVDPVEKKPLNHFLPGTSVLSFGTAGCNLGCRFCQNWSISKSREVASLSEHATPDQIAAAAVKLECRSVAFTYNDPVIWAEYAIDAAKACHERGVKTIAVTAGYISPAARPEFYSVMDAANVDLKAFTEVFYQHLSLSHLEPVLDTLKWLKHESDVWFEITNLMIPEENDSPEETARMCDWLIENVGDDVPIHFTAFHPDFKLMNRPATPHATLIRAREQALKAGIKYAYVGNVYDVERQSTYCPQCKEVLIERDWFELGVYRLQADRCSFCDGKVAGVFEQYKGNWGRRRLPVIIENDQVSPGFPSRHQPDP
jgi:AmmeMemoRadiSam system radical SAM enzyme